MKGMIQICTRIRCFVVASRADFRIFKQMAEAAEHYKSLKNEDKVLIKDGEVKEIRSINSFYDKQY